MRHYLLTMYSTTITLKHAQLLQGRPRCAVVGQLKPGIATSWYSIAGQQPKRFARHTHTHTNRTPLRMRRMKSRLIPTGRTYLSVERGLARQPSPLNRETS